MTATVLSASENNDHRDSPLLRAPSGANHSMDFADGNGHGRGHGRGHGHDHGQRRKYRSLFRSKPGRQPKVKHTRTVSAMKPSESPPNGVFNKNIDRIELVAMKNNENRSIIRIIVGKQPRKQKKREGIEMVSGVQVAPESRVATKANGGNASNMRFGDDEIVLCGNWDQMRSPVTLDRLQCTAINGAEGGCPLVGNTAQQKPLTKRFGMTQLESCGNNLDHVRSAVTFDQLRCVVNEAAGGCERALLTGSKQQKPLSKMIGMTQLESCGGNLDRAQSAIVLDQVRSAVNGARECLLVPPTCIQSESQRKDKTITALVNHIGRSLGEYNGNVISRPSTLGRKPKASGNDDEIEEANANSSRDEPTLNKSIRTSKIRFFSSKKQVSWRRGKDRENKDEHKKKKQGANDKKKQKAKYVLEDPGAQHVQKQSASPAVRKKIAIIPGESIEHIFNNIKKEKNDCDASWTSSSDSNSDNSDDGLLGRIIAPWSNKNKGIRTSAHYVSSADESSTLGETRDDDVFVIIDDDDDYDYNYDYNYGYDYDYNDDYDYERDDSTSIISRDTTVLVDPFDNGRSETIVGVIGKALGLGCGKIAEPDMRDLRIIDSSTLGSSDENELCEF
eukprot:CAMPEP_0168277816 /NCGR_PEP_ID=MMETSP0141_2-20121125/19465_1 /TAXON_ID=44445 /ORGANISM="Pseudo-nitzschia australis, Strain 10249 10 AB" /LENGTH=617 /DNA_ID=CAMNT_0008220359 /DNA_START=44 /DNA_END=1896 /DNA_ORIENTATION=-